MDPHEEHVFDLVEETALQLLGHPLRLRLLGMLRADGPSTASKLGTRLGESSGLASYHLRRLAEAGLIEEATELGSGRDRWWRAVHSATRWFPSDFVGSATGRKASAAFRREAMRWQEVALEQYLVEEPEWDPAWVEIAGSNDALLHLTPAQGRELERRLLEVVDEFADAAQPDQADAARLLVFIHLIPNRRFPV